MAIQDIPKQKVKDDSGFHKPADELIAAIREYYQREHGVSLSEKDVENQIVKIIRSRV